VLKNLEKKDITARITLPNYKWCLTTSEPFAFFIISKTSEQSNGTGRNIALKVPILLALHRAKILNSSNHLSLKFVA